MSDGLAITFQVLTESRNHAVGDVLAFAYESHDPQIRRFAIESILRSPRGQGSLRVVETWHELVSDFRELILKSPRQLIGGIRAALRSKNRQAVENGLELTALLGESQLMPELLRLAENERCALKPRAERVVIAVADSMAQKAKSASDRHYVQRSTIRGQVVECLEKAVQRYPQHRCLAIVEAFLISADSSSHYLKRCLSNPRDMAMSAIVKVLAESNRSTIVDDMLVELLASRSTPPTVVRVWSQRADFEFIQVFCIKVGKFPNDIIRRNLKRMKSVRWLKGSLSHLSDLNEHQQIAVVQILRHASLDKNDVFRVIEFLMIHGSKEVRRRAAEKLRDIRTPAADRLVSRYVEHEDPAIQSIMLSQLRDRNIPGAVAALVRALDSEHPQVQNAAQRSFPDIDIDRYLVSFDSMDDESQRSSGELMLKIDKNAIPKIESELSSGIRNRRLRAVHVVEVLGLIDQLCEAVAEVLDEDDYFVRLEAVRLLGRCRSSFSRRVLRDAMMDPSSKVRRAAEKALQGMASIPPSAKANPRQG